MPKAIYYLILFFIFSTTLYSDTIILLNGKTIKGTIVGQDIKSIVIEDVTGNKQSFDKDQVSKVVYKEMTPKEIDDAKKEAKNSSAAKKTGSKKRPKESSAPEEDELAEAGDTIRNNNNSTIKEKETYREVIHEATTDPNLVKAIDKLHESVDLNTKLVEKDAEIREKELALRREELEYRKKEDIKLTELLVRENRQRQIDIDNLKEERKKLAAMIEKEKESRKLIEKRVGEVEVRNRRLELYLGMDETMIEYYKGGRSRWSIVWRSAVLPGYGQNYAKDEFTSTFFSVTFFTTLGLGAILYYTADQAEEKVRNKLYTDVVINPLVISSSISRNFSDPNVASAAFSSTFTTLSNVNVNKINSANNAIEAIGIQKELGHKLIQIAGIVYLANLVHAYFIGVQWEKTKPRDYSDEEIKKMGWNFDMKYDTNGSRLPIDRNAGMRADISYGFVF